MKNTMKAMKKGQMGMNRAVLEYDVPKTNDYPTLNGQFSEKVTHRKPIDKVNT